jgi:hypothetical protein
MTVHKDIAIGAAVLITLAALMTWLEEPEAIVVPAIDRLPLYPTIDARHLTDWEGLSGGTTIGAKPVKTIVVHPNVAPALPWPVP